MDFSQAILQKVSVHYLGDGQDDGTLRLSGDVVDISNEALHDALKTYFLAGFQRPEYYRFVAPAEDPELHAVREMVSQLFHDPTYFHTASQLLARTFHGIDQPGGPSGEFYLAAFANLVVDQQVVSGAGIFQVSEKQRFLMLEQDGARFRLSALKGVPVNRPEKGCLIFNTAADEGYKICLLDNSRATGFWQHRFLMAMPWPDDYHHTRQFLDLTRSYLVDQMQDEFNVSKADQIDLLNRSMEYFKTRDQFDQREFENEVFADANVIESFRRFGTDFRQQADMDDADQFEISAQAVKRQARIFKSVLKLDKNFHVYIHGNRDLIEKGFDETVGKHYYKIYFDQER